MTRSFGVLTLFVVCYLCASIQRASAEAGRCSQQTIDRLERDSDGIRDWSKLRIFYRRYRACKIDDAEVTTGVSESVARMFADHWETLKTASILFKQDPAFEKFALAGLNITDSTDDLNQIDRLATDHCPAGLHILCRKIRESIRNDN